MIRAAGARLFFLSPYSPHLNPIEQVFAKLKTLLHKLRPRTVEQNWRGIGQFLPRFSSSGARTTSEMQDTIQSKLNVL